MSSGERFVRAYFEHVTDRVAANSNALRDVVAGLDPEVAERARAVIRFDVFEKDVTRRGLIPQAVFVEVRRLVDGSLTVLPEDTAADVVVSTDIRTLFGLARGEMYVTTPAGRVRVCPFAPRDAVRMHLIDVTGGGTGMRNLLLLERLLLPELERALRVDEPTPPAPV